VKFWESGSRWERGGEDRSVAKVNVSGNQAEQARLRAASERETGAAARVPEASVPREGTSRGEGERRPALPS